MKKILLTSNILIALLFLSLVSCQKETNDVHQIEQKIKPIPYKKLKKNSDERHKKGIEQMAEYQFQIRKIITDKEPTYQKGYLFEEFKKAITNKSLFKSAKALNPTFIERGPANVPGRTRGMAIDPTNNKRWFVGSVSGGVWLTENEGVSWVNLTDTSIPNLSTSTIVISPQDKNTLYVGTGEPFGNLGALGGAGIFKTTDGGTTWSSLGNSSSFGDVGRIIINPTNKNNVLVGTKEEFIEQ